MRTFHRYKGIEVSGLAVYGLVQAFGQFKVVASKYLLEEGIGQKGLDGLVVVDPAAWYPMQANLRALVRFSEGMSDSVVHQIGVSVGMTSDTPFPIQDMKTFVKSLDAGYHMHHRKHGHVMRDPSTGQILEGIGHYLCRERPDGTLEVETDAPYPCAFDRGILFSGLRRVHAMGAILHDDSHPCRERGQPSCVYVVKV